MNTLQGKTLRETKNIIAEKRLYLLRSWSMVRFVKLADIDRAMVFEVTEKTGEGALSSVSKYILTVYPSWDGYHLGDGGHEYMKPVKTTLR
jgi:hypothetical protein